MGGRKFLTIYFADGSQRYMPYARYLLECRAGRRLRRNEHVHHLDENFCNDDISNLELKVASDHIREHRPAAELLASICPECEKSFSASARYVRYSQQKQNKAGPFCSKSCAGKYSQKLGSARRTPALRTHGTEMSYRYGKCRCQLCVDRHRERCSIYRARSAAKK